LTTANVVNNTVSLTSPLGETSPVGEMRPFTSSPVSTLPYEFNLTSIISVSEEAFEFVVRNPETSVSFRISEELSEELRSLKIDAEGEMRLMRDAESPDWQGLVIEFRIKDMSYPEILGLWDRVSKEAFEKIDPEAARKIDIVLSRS